MNHSIPFPVDAVLLLGPTGSGKSPLGDLLTRRGLLGRRAHHLDFGSALRSALSDSAAYYTDGERDFIRGVLERGLLLENEHFPLARKILSAALGQCGFSRGDVLVLNGIPRHAGQARDMAALTAVRALVVLECSPDAVSCRLRENTGGDRVGRQDDDRDLVRKKLDIFRERTTPLIDHYGNAGCKVYRIPIDGSTTAEDAYAKLSLLAAGDPPVSLVAEPPQR